MSNKSHPMTEVRSIADAIAPRSRSAVTNGKRLHVRPVGDTAWSRRFRDVLGEIVSDLGGPDRLSEGQRQLARRCATIALECERLEAKSVAGEAIDLDVYGQLTDRLGRAFQRLGLKRVARPVPSLSEYLAAQAPEIAAEASNERNEPALGQASTDDEKRVVSLPNGPGEARDGMLRDAAEGTGPLQSDGGAG
jgi:hypothetical protein